MRKNLTDNELASYVTYQLNNYFPDANKIQCEDISKILSETLLRVEKCFTKINNKYFSNGIETRFDHLHGDQYSMFLYLLANTNFKLGGPAYLSSKLFLLNKAMFGIDAYFEVELPEVFLFVHPLGTVLGRGAYSDYFMVYQGCGVGSNHDIYPEMGKFTTLRPQSFLLGKSKLGENCSLAAGSLVIDRELSDNSVYFGNPMDFKIKKNESIASIWRI